MVNLFLPAYSKLGIWVTFARFSSPTPHPLKISVIFVGNSAGQLCLVIAAGKTGTN